MLDIIKNPKRILSIHHKLAMGEVILLSVAFRIIKENIPEATLSVVAGGYACDFIKSIPYVDSVMPIERFGIFMGNVSRLKRLFYRPFIVPKLSMFLRRGNYDCVFIRDDERLPYTRLIRTVVDKSNIKEVVALKSLMQKHLNSSRHVVEGYLAILKELGFKVSGDERPVFAPTSESIERAISFLEKHGISKNKHKIVGLSPTSAMKIKEMDIEKVSELCRMLAKDQSVKILLFSTNKEYTNEVLKSVNEPPVIVGYLPFNDLIALVAQCNQFISVDTGPMHVAAAVGVPTIGIFGPTSGKMFGPYGKDCIVLQKTPDCPHYRPDSFFSPEEKTFQACYIQDRCLIMDRSCVDLISPGEIIETLSTLKG